jgi:GntR family transcriptional regulator/MocR family aminotransferase
MTNSSDPAEWIRLELDRQSQTPFYRQIYERFCDAIAHGILRPGEKLPSARSLASQLATSRGTVDLAYSLLSGEGYVLSQGAAGTIVAPGLSGNPTNSSHRPRVEPAASEPAVTPFQMGLPALDAFPRKLWSRLATRRARVLPPRAMGSPNPIGYTPLRTAIASYLAVSRGILCSSEQLFITPGFQGALGLITRAFLHPGDDVWFEDPGYFLARMGLHAAGASLVPVPVDSEGLDVAAGIARSPHARFAFVTPSHQAPLGVALSLPRRLALLSWAASTEAWIIEDDYDSEFRYGSRPLPALKSLDESGRVLYLGTFSKVLFPGLRLGYLVVPESQIDRFSRVCQLLYRDLPLFNQTIVTDFMLEGHFARHIRRMRKLYSDRRSALAAALAEVFRSRIDVQLQAGGMHLLARFANCSSDLDLVARATMRGLAPAALSPWNVQSDCGQGLLLSFTNIPRDTAVDAAVRLKQAIAAR